MIKSEKLGKYYIEEKFSLSWPTTAIGKLDKNGTILYKLPYTNRYVYYPIQVAQYALGNFEMFIDTKYKKYKNTFLKQVNWLIENFTDKGDFGIWEHHYVLPHYKFDRIPWVHGMGQGLAISALLRAYQLSNDKIYLEVAKKAYGAFEKDIHILNGFIFALFGIYDFYRVTRSKKALNLFDKGVKTLEKNLNLYDNGYWSLYNLIHKYPATKFYHEWHIKQLKVLHELTGKDIFNEYAKRWEKYTNKSINRFRASLRRMIIHWKRHRMKILNIYLMKKRWLKE